MHIPKVIIVYMCVCANSCVHVCVHVYQDGLIISNICLINEYSKYLDCIILGSIGYSQDMQRLDQTLI